jgi:hypothetical protein
MESQHMTSMFARRRAHRIAAGLLVTTVIFTMAFSILARAIGNQETLPVTPTPVTGPFTHEIGDGYFLIQAENYDPGGQDAAYHDTTVGNQGGAYRHDDVDIKSIGEGRYAVGWMATGEWLRYTVDVAESGWYDLVLRASTIMDDATIRIEIDGEPFVSVVIPKTRSYADLQEIVVMGRTIEAGQRVIRVIVEREYFDLDWLRFVRSERAGVLPTPLPLLDPDAPREAFGVRERTYTCPASAVSMTPGDTLQAIVDAHPAGTVYCMAAGTYRNQTIVPKSGDVYIGQPGAIMDGGETTRFAFRSILEPNQSAPIRNVTIRGLTVQRYASAGSIKNFISPEGAIEAGEGWVIEGNLIQNNISGLSMGRGNWGWGDGAVIRDNRIVDNLEIGVEINGSNILFEHNELARNGGALNDQDRAWAGGGSKFTDQPVFANNQFRDMIQRSRSPDDHLIIRYNHVHSNVGIGLWLDINNRYAIIEHNLIEDNYGSGILDELSAYTTIRFNILRNNRAGNSSLGLWGGAEVLIVNSQQGGVYENDMTITAHGRAVLMIYESYRGEYPSRDYLVHNNVFRFRTLPDYRDPYHPIGGILGGGGNEPFWTSNNRYDNNTYYVPEPGLDYWFWGEPMTWDRFRERGHEANGRCFHGEAEDATPC